MSIDPHALAELCRDIYDPRESHHWLNWWEMGDVVVARTQIGDSDIIVFRGSVTPEDWLRDIEALPEYHSSLGFVHSGFVAGMEDVLREVVRVIGKNVVVTGHSLGGSRARILAALMVTRGYPIDQVTVFGSPRPGFKCLSGLIQQVPIHTSYRNRQDAVPIVPGLFPEWVHPEEWIPVDCAPDDTTDETFKDHSIHLYCKALARG